MFNGQKGRGRPSQSAIMKMSRQGGKVALKKKDVFLTSFPLEEFRFDPMPMDPSHPFAWQHEVATAMLSTVVPGCVKG